MKRYPLVQSEFMGIASRPHGHGGRQIRVRGCPADPRAVERLPVDRYEPPFTAQGLSWNHPAYRNFASLDRRALDRLFELGRAVEITAGHEVLRAGTAGDGIHLVLSGRLAVERAGHRLRALEPGDFFGEAVLFRPDP